VLVICGILEALWPGMHDIVDMEELVLDVLHRQRRSYDERNQLTSVVLCGSSFIVNR
jgi:hypothetical protein